MELMRFIMDTWYIYAVAIITTFFILGETDYFVMSVSAQAVAEEGGEHDERLFHLGYRDVYRRCVAFYRHCAAYRDPAEMD